MITLAIDTSTPRGSVALLTGDDLLLAEDFLADRSHSASLFGALERARQAAPRIDQLAIGLGPGSYAGVRIAIAAAIGLRLALGAKLVGIPSVAAFESDAREYLAIGDARRETFYFTRVIEGRCEEGPLLLSESELRERLAAQTAYPVLTSTPLSAFPAARLAFPSALILARLAAAGRGIVAEDNLEPIYLREPYITMPRPRPAEPYSGDVPKQARVV